jgi:triosephosphate isomerase
MCIIFLKHPLGTSVDLVQCFTLQASCRIKEIAQMNRYTIAGNWKMNTSLSEGETLAGAINTYLSEHKTAQTRVVLGVPFTHLGAVAKEVAASKVLVVAQNCSEHQEGAYTGEVSAKQIKSTGAGGVILGHSERREYHMESDEVINQKLRRCLEEALVPILCVGEVQEERQEGKQENRVAEQLKGGLAGLEADQLTTLIIAYEPVWAIGTGETASPQQAQEMHAFIRKYLSTYYGEAFAGQVHLLYGGSMKPENAADLLGMADVDGGLIGGASLKADSFVELIKAAEAQ